MPVSNQADSPNGLSDEQILSEVLRPLTTSPKPEDLSDEEILQKVLHGPERVSETLGREAKAGELEAERSAIEQEKKAVTLPRLGQRLLLGLGSGAGQLAAGAGEYIENPPSMITQMPGYQVTKLIPGVSKMREAVGRRIRERGEAIAKPFEEAGAGIAGPAGEFAQGVTETMVGTIPTLIPAAGGSLPGAAVMAAAQTYSMFLNQGAQVLADKAEEQGVPFERADAIERLKPWAEGAGAITAALTRFIPGGVERLSRNLWKGIQNGTVTKEGIKAFAKNVFKESLLEVPEEVPDQFAQELMLKVSAEPDKPIGEVVSSSLMAGPMAFVTTLATGGLGGGARLSMRGVRKGAEYYQSKRLKAQYPEAFAETGAALISPKIRDLIPAPELDLLKREAGVEEENWRAAVQAGHKAGHIKRVGNGIEVLAEWGRMPTALEEVLTSASDPVPNPMSIQLLQELPESPPPLPATARAAAPSISLETPTLGRVNTPNLLAIANNQLERLRQINKRGDLNKDQKVRLAVLEKLIPQGGKPAVAPALAPLFNVTLDEAATEMPAAFSFIPTTTEGGETRAPQIRKVAEGDIGERRGIDTGVQAEREDRYDQAAQPQARPADRQRDRGQEGRQAAQARQGLTPTQNRNYQGGPLVLIAGQEDQGPAEVLDQADPQSFTVRKLTDGTVVQVGRDAVTPYLTLAQERKVARRAERKTQKEKAVQRRHELLTAKEAEKQRLTLETTPRTRPAESRIDTDLRVEEPIQVTGITYAPPVDPRDVRMANRIVTALAKLKRKFPNVQFNAIRWVRTQDAKDPDIFTQPSETGLETISIDLTDLVYKLRDADDRALDNWLNAALEEEVFEIAGDMAIQNDYVTDGGPERTGMTFDDYWEWRHEGMWEDMTQDQRDRTVEVYGMDPNDHARVAAEFARMVVQNQISGRTTEETLGARVIEYLKGMWQQLQAMVNQVRTGALQNRLLNHAIAIQQILQQQEQAAGQEQALRRRRMGAAPIRQQQTTEFPVPLGDIFYRVRDFGNVFHIDLIPSELLSTEAGDTTTGFLAQAPKVADPSAAPIDNAVIIGHMLLPPAMQKQGIGTKVVLGALRYAQMHGLGYAIDPVASDANVALHERFKRAGVPLHSDEHTSHLLTPQEVAALDLNSVAESFGLNKIPTQPEGMRTRRMGARIISMEDLQAELVAESVLPAEQVRKVHQGNLLQNYSTIAHVNQYWDTIPDEHKAHLPTVESRIGAYRNEIDNHGFTEPTGSIWDAVNAAAPGDFQTQSQFYRDAWENTHSLLEDEVELKIKADEAHAAMIAATKRPPEKELTEVVREMSNTQKERLLMQRDLAAQMGQDVSQINAEIREWDKIIRNGNTAMERGIKFILQGGDAANIDWKSIGVSQLMADLVQPAFANYTPEALTELASTVIAKEVQAFNDINSALGFLRNSVIQTPEFQRNLKLLVDITGVSAIVSEEKLKNGIVMGEEFEDPFDREIKVRLEYDADASMTRETRDKAVELALRMQEFIETPGADPLRVAAYRQHLYRLLQIELNPAFDPKAAHPMTSEWNMMKLATGFGHLTSPEFRLEGLGTREAAIAMQQAMNKSQALSIVMRVWREQKPNVEFYAAKAAKSHGWKNDVKRWNERVANPVIASMQEMGSVHLRAGSRYRGVVITDEDIKAIQLQKKMVDGIYTALRDMETVQAKAYPLKIQEKGRLIPILRDALAGGEMVMPRKRNNVLLSDYTQKFQRIFEQTTSKEERVLEIKRIVAGRDSEGFWNLVEGNMRDAVQIPSYAKFINSPFRETYRRLIAKIDSVTPDRPLSFDDVVQAIFDDQAGRDPEDQLSKADIEERILDNEIGKGMRAIIDQAEQSRKPGGPITDIDITSSDNFLTVPRGPQVVPRTLLDYPVDLLSQQHAIMHSVAEVYGQRYLDSLKTLLRTIDMERNTMELEIKRIGEQAAREKYRKEQMFGNRFWNIDEAKYHAAQIALSIGKMEQALKGRRDFFNEEVHSGVRALNQFTGSSILNQAHIVLRNRSGGTLRLMQLDDALMGGATLFGWRIPGTQLVIAPTKRVFQTGKQLLRWISGSGLLEYKFFQTKAGQEILRQMDQNSGFFADYLGGLFEVLRSESLLYAKMRQFGMAGDAKWTDSVRNILYFFNQGGQLREDNPSFKTKLLRFAEAASGFNFQLGILTAIETGLLGGVPIPIPRGALAKSADMAANAHAMNAADGILKRLQVAAVRAYQNRNELGVLDRTDQLTAAELFGNGAADPKIAGMLRTMFQKAGINIDAKMIEYGRAVEQARAAGRDVDSVEFLTTPEYNSLQMQMASEVNWSNWANRPEALTSSNMGKIIGQFYGYPLWLNTRYALNSARMSNQHGAARVQGAWRTGKWLAMAVMLGFLTEPLIRALQMLLYDEERQTPRIAEAETAGEATRILIQEAGPYFPILAGVGNYMIEAVKPGGGIGAGAIQFVPFELFKTMIDTGRETFQTGDWMRPTLKFVRRWAPNTKSYVNRMPFNEGMTDYLNVNRSIRAAAPREFEPRRFTPGASPYARGSTSDNKDNVINALMKTDGTDWNTVFRERTLGIQQLIKEGNQRAEQAFDAGVLSRNSWMAVFGRTITAAERQKILDRMTVPQQQRVRRMEGAFMAYSQAVGRTLNLTVEQREKPKKAQVWTPPRRGPAQVPSGSPQRTFVP